MWTITKMFDKEGLFADDEAIIKIHFTTDGGTLRIFAIETNKSVYQTNKE